MAPSPGLCYDATDRPILNLTTASYKNEQINKQYTTRTLD